jgi:hypothetical protein
MFFVCSQETVESDAVPISAEGAAVSAKDKLAQRLALQRVSSSALRVFGAACFWRLLHNGAQKTQPYPCILREGQTEKEALSHQV